MTKATINYDGLNRGVSGLIKKLGLESKVVVAKESGELIKTLVNISPPKDPGKTRKQIESDITGKFAAVGDVAHSNTKYSGKVGASGILWYGIDSEFLRGVAAKDDKRKASVAELKVLRHRITKRGRLNLPFKHPRKRQRVLLYQTVLTKASTVKKLIASVKKNVGRLKAGWLVAVASGPIRFTGGRIPPAWVAKHAQGAQGSFINGLESQKFPRFTLINFAKGIGNRKLNMRGIAQAAVNIRGKAIQANIKLFLSGKKKLSQYA